MAKDSLYIVGPKVLLEGLLNNPNFKNRGAVRYSLDDTQMLLEEAPEMFEDSIVNSPQVQSFDEDGARQFVQDNKADWEEEDLIE